MAGIRWRSVLPLSLLLLTLIAARNMFIYVAHLPQDGSNFASDVADDDQQLRFEYRKDERSRRISGPVADADQRPETNSEERAPENVVKRKHRSEKKAKLKAFELFPDDEKVVKSGQADEEEERADGDIRHPEPDEQDMRREESNKEETIEKSKERGDHGEVVDEGRGDEFGVDVRKKESEKEEKRERLKDRVVVKDELGVEVEGMHKKRIIMLNDSHANVPLPEEDALMMANMGEVGAIVRKMKDSSSTGSGNGSSSRQPVKPHPFKYVINSPKICADDDVFIVVYIHTATDHYKRRTLIRQTWGDASQYDVTVRLVFVMGIVLESDGGQAAQNALRFEAEQYGDIVQVSSRQSR